MKLPGKLLRHGMVCVLALVLASCSAGLRKLPTDMTRFPPRESHVIVIMKVSPAKPDWVTAKVGIGVNGINLEGDLIDRFVSFDSSSQVHLKAEGGYVVFTARKNSRSTAYYLHSISENPAGFEFREATPAFDVGCGAYTLGINVTEPGVYYAGDIRYRYVVTDIGEEKYVFEVDSDLESAKAFLDSQYPTLSQRPLREVTPVQYWKEVTCTPTVTVIYI